MSKINQIGDQGSRMLVLPLVMFCLIQTRILDLVALGSSPCLPCNNTIVAHTNKSHVVPSNLFQHLQHISFGTIPGCNRRVEMYLGNFPGAMPACNLQVFQPTNSLCILPRHVHCARTQSRCVWASFLNSSNNITKSYVSSLLEIALMIIS